MIACCFSSSVVGVRVLGITIVRCWCVVSSCNTGSRKISPLHSSFKPILQCFRGERRDCHQCVSQLPASQHTYRAHNHSQLLAADSPAIDVTAFCVRTSSTQKALVQTFHFLSTS